MIWPAPKPPVQISIIVPLRVVPGSIRHRNWRWLYAYWRHELPNAELIIGRSQGEVFSKTEAVNNGVARSRGRILAVIDGDCYLPGSVIQECADALDASLARGIPRWFIPYRTLYRLTSDATDAAVLSDPADPWRMPDPPPDDIVESTVGSLHGRRYGALITIYPREAADLIGGMDPRFIGWGGEDIAYARALDTLYAKHKTTPNAVTHFWHPKIGASYVTRTWAGQDAGGERANGDLAYRYSRATGDRARMRALVDEGIAWGREPQTPWERVKGLLHIGADWLSYWATGH